MKRFIVAILLLMLVTPALAQVQGDEFADSSTMHLNENNCNLAKGNKPKPPPLLGLTKKQPIFPGGIIYRFFQTAKTPKGPSLHIDIFYKGLRDGALDIECKMAEYWAGKQIKELSKSFNIPIASDNKASLNVTDYPNTLLITVDNNTKCITFVEGVYKKEYPIKLKTLLDYFYNRND